MRSAWLVCLMLVLAACTDQQALNGPQEPETKVELVCDSHQTSCAVSIAGHVLAPDDEGLGYVEGSEVGEALRLILIPERPDLPALKPLSFELLVASGNQRALLEEGSLVAAWIEGRDMFMGEHRLEYAFQAESRSFELKGMIPVCVTGSEMVWRLNLQLKINNTQVQAFADLRTLGQT